MRVNERRCFFGFVEVYLVGNVNALSPKGADDSHAEER